MTAWRAVFFKPHEFSCKCGCGLGGEGMDGTFIRRLDDLRAELGFPLRVTSGIRCPAWNSRVSNTGQNGPHTTGHAADIAVAGAHAHALIGMAVPLFSGVGVAQKSNHATRFIHLDDLPPTETRPRPWLWSY